MDNKKNGIPKLRFPGFTGAWEQRKLGDYLSIPTKEPITDINELKLMTLKLNLEGITLAANRETLKLGATKYYKRHEGQLLYGKQNFFHGSISLIPKEAEGYATSGDVPALNISNINSKYLVDYISRPIYFEEKEALATGTGSKRIHEKTLFNFKIAVPSLEEQSEISNFIAKYTDLIALHQRKLEHLKEQKKGLLQKMFPKNGEVVPEVRFPGFTDDWEQRKLGEEFKKVNERNNGEFGKDRWISVAKMYFQDPDKVTSNNIDTRTYVMRLGDIAFEGHPNNEFKFGRFVANDIGDGVVSELFPIYRHIRDYDNNYWKYAIHLERIMGPIFAKSITSSGNSSNKLAPKDLLRQSIFLPHLDEQKQIGYFFKQFDSLIALHQRKLEHLKLMKKGLLQQMFV